MKTKYIQCNECKTQFKIKRKFFDRLPEMCPECGNPTVWTYFTPRKKKSVRKSGKLVERTVFACGDCMRFRTFEPPREGFGCPRCGSPNIGILDPLGFVRPIMVSDFEEIDEIEEQKVGINSFFGRVSGFVLPRGGHVPGGVSVNDTPVFPRSKEKEKFKL